MNTSNWVKKSQMDCPWTDLDFPNQSQNGFIEWYLILSENTSDEWDASRVLLSLLKILPKLSPNDQKVLFAHNCFGKYQPWHFIRQGLNESQTVTAFTVSLSRAQALIDLALLLRLRHPYGFQGRDQRGECFTDWYLSYTAALKYHNLASGFLSSLPDIHQANPHRLKFHIQEMRFSKFHTSDFDLGDPHLQDKLEYPTPTPLPMLGFYHNRERMRIFPEWILPLLVLIDTDDLSEVTESSDFTVDLAELLRVQRDENEDLIGYMETCALLYDALPYIWNAQPPNEDKSNATIASLSRVSFNSLVFQTMNVAIRLTTPIPGEEYNPFIFQTISSLPPIEDPDFAAAQNTDSHQETFDTPLHLLFLHTFLDTEPMDFYRERSKFIPSLISDILIQGAAGAIRCMFEAELREGAQIQPFLTSEILFSTDRAEASLSSCISAGKCSINNLSRGQERLFVEPVK